MKKAAKETVVYLITSSAAFAVLLYIGSLLWGSVVEPEYMRVYDVRVETVKAGTMPTVFADRKIHKGDPYGIWSAEVIPARGAGVSICAGGISIPGIYNTSPRQVREFTLDDWVGDDCSDVYQVPGQYVQVTKWTLWTDDQGRSQTITYYSPPFEIMP